ncbi:Uncharacterised protein [BD1-7 clade bacterium]|nr:Uncharacterised protein [BD1-7 clade bacterium]
MKSYLFGISTILFLCGCGDSEDRKESNQMLSGSLLVGEWENSSFPEADSYTIIIDEKGSYFGVVIGSVGLLQNRCDGLDLTAKYKLTLPEYQISQLEKDRFSITPKNGIEIIATNIESGAFSCKFEPVLVRENSIDVHYKLLNEGDGLTLIQLGQESSYQRRK